MRQLITLLLAQVCPVLLFAQMPSGKDTTGPLQNKTDSSLTQLKRNALQSHAVPEPQTEIEAQVFTLDAKDPSVLKVYNNYTNSTKKVFKKNLEMSCGQTASFKIIHINPMRYSYYINGQLVTQFMENNPVITSINELGNIAPAAEIVALDIFNADKDILSQKNEIDKAKDELKLLMKPVDDYQSELTAIVDSSRFLPRDSSVETRVKIKALDIKYARVNSALQNSIKVLTDRLAELNLALNKLAINANGVSVITGLQKSLLKLPPNTFVSATVNRMNYYINEYLTLDSLSGVLKRELNAKIQPVDQTSFHLSLSSKASKRVDTTLSMLLDKIGYPSTRFNFIQNSDDLKYNALQPLEFFRVEEFITDKKISSLGNLLTELYLELGKLLQDGHVQFSRQLNRIKNLSYITSEDEEEVKEIAEQINGIFTTIQTVNAHISVLVVFMQINNPQARELGKTINTLYKSLLGFLKITDYIREGTTNKYTLALNPNGSNSDLVRYSIKQEDIVTKNTQSYVYDIWIKGGLKIDFSVGIFGSGLIDEVYEKKPHYNGSQVSDTTFSLAQKDNGNYGFAFGGMVNISPRLGASWVTPGISLGVAYGDNKSLQFLTTGSLHLGKSERLLLHAGWVFGASKVLDRSAIVYAADEKYVRGDIANYPIPYTDKFLGRFIFGISYNLSKKSAFQGAAGQGLTTFNANIGATP